MNFRSNHGGEGVPPSGTQHIILYIVFFQLIHSVLHMHMLICFIKFLTRLLFKEATYPFVFTQSVYTFLSQICMLQS